MKTACFSAILLVAGWIISGPAYSEEPTWKIFDQDYPHDYIDTASITSPEKGIMRFWERAGDQLEVRNGKTIYPTYNLEEINCSLRTQRQLRWDMALEAQTTPEGMKARSKFLEETVKLQGNYPSTWESFEPNKHNYARHDFVCKKSPQE
jgi:hypothetical protein